MRRMDVGFVVLMVTVIIVALLLAGCGSSCAGLQATERDRQAVADGYEVEREGKYDQTCELKPNGTWEVDD